MPDESATATYREILAEWRLGQIAFVYGLTALSLLVFFLTAELAQSGFLSKSLMIAIRVPFLAAAIVVFTWSVQCQVRKLVS